MVNENKLEQFLKKKNLTDDEVITIINKMGYSEPVTNNKKSLNYKSPRVKFLIASDLHMGHKNYRPDVLDHAIRNANRQKVDFWVMPGDILEGMSGREGHIYELAHVGATNQLEYGVEQLNQIKQPIYAITATDSHDGWFSSKNNMGFEVGPELERRVKNLEFLGYDEADLILDNGINIRLTHPGGGTAYAVSYKMQKYVNALSGGQKPDIIAQGHYHKAMYMFYRNIHCFESGCLENQSTFMKKIGTPAMVGYWIVDAWANEKGVEKIKTEFVPFFE